MKNLIYSPFVLFIVLLAASCQKEAAVGPSKALQLQDSLVTISLINNSSTPYVVSFLGMVKYNAEIQPNARQIAQVKPGTYTVEVYPSGASGYVSHTITWDNFTPISAPRANFNNVLIPFASSQSLLIY